MKHSCAFLFFFLFSCLLFAQSTNKKLGKARFLKSFNYESLAHELTDGVTSDSLKVKSIYLWMTKHIDYDVYGFASGSGSYTDPDDILLHRKTVCLGYSILFDSLCSVAGIKAECVYGYVYMPWYETYDTLYLDSHAWNAVEIDGQWQLVDATWGSGYVKERKQTGRKILYRLFRIPYRTKYRFVHQTNMKYYCTDPEVFVLDHLPSTPAWQLLDCSVPIDSFQRTPQATINHLSGGTTCGNGNDSIQRIVDAPQQDHLYIAGQQALATNANNHQDISIGQWERLKVVMEMAGDTSFSLERRIQMWDSAMVMSDSLIVYFKLTAKDAKLEGGFFERRNRRMREQTVAETKPQLQKHKKAIDDIHGERFRIHKQVGKLKQENKRLRKENKRVRKKELTVRRPVMAPDKLLAQRDTLLAKTERLNDSIASLRDSMLRESYFNYSWEVVYYDTIVKQKKRRLRLEFYDMREVNFFRAQGFTCYDTCVFTPKRQYLQTQKEVDSLNKILPRPGKWIMDSAATEYKKDAYLAKLLLRMTLANYKQLAKMPASAVDEQAAFDSAKETIININDSLISNNKERINDLRYYGKTLRKFRLMHYRVKFALQREMRHEAWRYVVTREFFRSYFKGVNLAFRHNANVARSVKTECRQKKKTLERKLAKQKREEEKRKKKTGN